MGRRGPRKKLNLVRKWWAIHKITAAQLEMLVRECRRQLPVLENQIDIPIVISSLVAEKAKLVEEELFDASEFLKSFNPGDGDEEREEEEVAPKVVTP